MQLCLPGVLGVRGGGGTCHHEDTPAASGEAPHAEEVRYPANSQHYCTSHVIEQSGKWLFPAPVEPLYDAAPADTLTETS